VSGGFEVSYLNRIAKECDNCPVEGSLKTGNYQFLNEEMVDQGDGIYLFGGSNNEFFRIYSQATSSQVWNFDPINGITASILMISEMDIFGVPDSVKTIGLSNGLQILLSKNHGIIQFPDLLDGSDEMYELIGISNLGKGFVTPDFDQLYNWSPGTVLMYEEQSYFIGIAESTFRKHTVLEVETYTDSVVVFVEEAGNTVTLEYGYPVDTTTFYDANKRLVFYRNQLPGVDGQISEVVKNPTEWANGDHYAFISVEDMGNGRISKLLGAKNDEPSLFWPDQDDSGLLVLTQEAADAFHLEYETGLGITSYNLWIFESAESFELIGHIVDGVEEGVILSNDELLFTTSTREIVLEQKALKVAPNPVTDWLQISWELTLDKEASLRVYNTQGQLVEDLRISAGQNTHAIQTDHWPKGNYWVRIVASDWRGNERVVKQ
ncbi:MAG: T9SS type A sorting domain-containing protein, partial [Bacteroidota bacterium]